MGIVGFIVSQDFKSSEARYKFGLYGRQCYSPISENDPALGKDAIKRLSEIQSKTNKK